jgi:hypothetical protein
MSWGTKIALLYGAFVVMILTLVFRTSQETIDLESADYYAKELRFQEQIDGEQAVNTSGVKPVISMQEQVIVIDVPEALSAAPMTGTVQFYRPDDSSKDKTFALNEAHGEFALSNFSSGQYEVRMNWKASGEDYFFESLIYVP